MSVVVLNPSASSARRDLHGVRAAIAESTLLCGAEIVTSDGWDEGRRVAARAARDGCRLVVAAGGDGTVNSVVSGLMEPDRPRPVLGVLPLGTGNDLARSLGIPGGVRRALRELERMIVREMDVIRVVQDGTRYCANVSAGGFGGRVDERLTHEAKESWGPLAYLRTAVGNLPEMETYETVIEIDGGREVLEIPAFNVVVANARYAAAGVPVAPDALLDDGAMDVVVLASAALPRLGMAVARMAAGRHLDHELVTAFRARSVRIESEPEMWFNVDGELIGCGTTRFDVVAGALPVLVGADRPRAL